MGVLTHPCVKQERTLFFCSVDVSAAAANLRLGLALASHVLVVQCVWTLVLCTQTSAAFNFSCLIREYFPSGEGKLKSWQQEKKNTAGG